MASFPYKEALAGYTVYKLDECFASYSATAGVLILLDGLDEVSTSLYGRIERALQQFSDLLHQQGPNNKIILTMRTQFHTYISDSLADSFPVRLSVKSLSNTDIFEFLNNWPYMAGTNATPMRVFHSLTDRPALRDICTNPLILSMYVAEYQTADGIALPETRTLFYRRIVDELISRRRSHQLGITKLSFKDHELRFRILGESQWKIFFPKIGL